MKRFLPFILISSVILQFFAPFTIGTENHVSKRIIEANTENEAQEIGQGEISVGMKITPKVTNKTITLEVELDQNSKITDDFKAFNQNGNLYLFLKVTAFDLEGNEIDSGKSNDLSHKQLTEVFEVKLKNFKASTDYKIIVDLYKRVDTNFSTSYGSASNKGAEIKVGSQNMLIKSGSSSNTETREGDSANLNYTGTGVGKAKETNLPECGFTKIGGCIARIFYYVLFVPTSFLFGLAGKIMDFTIMYSVSDTSYRTPFVSEGWQVVRDLCNMFFIFILLYIALTTILDSGGSKNKASVVNVIIIGLLINFSLFATHLIIDASNIMARVFYNPKVIVIGEKDTSGEIKSTQDEELGHIPLSEGIVAKINPQRLLLQENQNVASSRAGSITQNSGINAGEDGDTGITSGTFILVTIMASIVNFVGMMTFLTISLSFIGRVIGLWVAMVLSPLAFLSYTVPETKNWSYVGWSSWWSETTKAAFMAPVFVFFMYIIVMFLESNMGLDLLTESSSLTDFNKILSIIIPFIVIIVLLKQAEKISTKLAGNISGQITSAVGNIGAKAGGLALGGALGLGAFAMRSTVGKMGASMANSSKLQDAEAKGGITGWGARQLRNVGSFAGKSSFDVKNTKIGQEAAKGLGVEGLKKGKTGGYVDYQSRVEKKVTDRAETLKSSDAKAAEQDAAAKDYNDKYQKSLYEMKKDKITLSDAAFETKYDGKKKKEITDKDFKEKYENDIKEQEKKERIQELASKNKPFNQKEQDKFEKEYTEKHKNDGKSSAEIYRDRVKTYKESVKQEGVWGANAGTMARIDKTLKDKSKDPDAEKPVTHKENFLAEKRKLEAEKIKGKLTQSEKDIEAVSGGVKKDIKQFSKELGKPLTIENIKQEDIDILVEKYQAAAASIGDEIEILRAQLNKKPNDAKIQNSLLLKLKEKRAVEAKTNRASGLIEKNRKNEDKRVDVMEKMNKQNNLITEQEEILERYKKEQTKKP